MAPFNVPREAPAVIHPNRACVTGRTCRPYDNRQISLPVVILTGLPDLPQRSVPGAYASIDG